MNECRMVVGEYPSLESPVAGSPKRYRNAPEQRVERNEQQEGR